MRLDLYVSFEAFLIIAEDWAFFDTLAHTSGKLD